MIFEESFWTWNVCFDFLYKFCLKHVSYLLTPWRRVLQKLTGCQLGKKFPAFSGIRRFIFAFTRAATYPYYEPDQSSPCSHPTSWRSILILSSNLCLNLPSGLIPWGKTFHVLTRMERDIVNVRRSSCKAYIILVRFLMNLECFRQILKTTQNSIFMKIRSVEAQMFHADSRTDGQTNRRTDMKKLIVVFRNLVKAPKNTLVKTLKKKIAVT